MQLKGFKHLNQDQRVEIYALKKRGLSNRKVATILGVHHTTIGRELKRNSIDYGRGIFKYKPIQAQKLYIQRKDSANYNHRILVKDRYLRNKIHGLLCVKGGERGPDEILGRLKLEGRKGVSTSTLYRYIRSNTNLSRHLRFKHLGYRKNKSNKKYERIKGVNKIDLRPKIVDKRSRIGDWEIDTIVSCKGGRGGSFTATERKSKYELIKKVGNLKADTLYITILACMKGEQVKTITSDNGSEFADLSKIQKELNVKCYTAHPYCSSERGTNERHNGLIRWYIPKGSDISKYSDQEIAIIQNKLNHKPRKCLDYRTPYEVYHNTNLTYI